MKKTNYIIIGVIIIIIVGVLFFTVNSKNIIRNDNLYKNSRNVQEEMPGRNNDVKGDMQMQELTEEEINSINGFFNSSPTEEGIEDYCNENMNYCMYYCMKNKEVDYCQNLIPKNRTVPEDFNPENMPPQ